MNSFFFFYILDSGFFGSPKRDFGLIVGSVEKGVWKSGKPESGIGTGIGTGTGTGTGIGTGMGRETYIKAGTTFTLI